MPLKYVKPTRITLKDHPEFTERWLQDRITEDPGILGLPGQPEVLDRERRQERAGRLDLLLYDANADRRYELELMLGSLDESHIIRAIEYWDIDRRRYPGYDHVAVVVAEDVTGRFLNILSLFAGTIPMIVLQCNALQVGDQVLLHFVKVLDHTLLRRDDEEESRVRSSSRDDWVNRSGAGIIALCDKAMDLLNAAAKKSRYVLTYNRQYIGVSDGARPSMFVFFGPRKSLVHIQATVGDVDAWVKRLSDVGLEAWPDPRRSQAGITVSPQDFDRHSSVIGELLAAAVAEYEA